MPLSLAVSKEVHANEFNFSVNPVLPENQIGESGYFNLQMSPGQSQTLTITLKNTTDKTVVVEEEIARDRKSTRLNSSH